MKFLYPSIKHFFVTMMVCVLLHSAGYSQASFPKSIDSIQRYFKEVEVASKLNFSIWDRDLYGPLLLVNPFTREAYANFPDSARILKQSGVVFTGKLPMNVSIGNISLQWGGLKWAMVLTPFISENVHDRVDLFSHELFHRIQPELGFTNFNELPNDHLDTKNGRLYLRLELEALKKALNSVRQKEKLDHIQHALSFRLYRYRLFPHAHMTEASVEINEGLASYIGKLARRLEEDEYVTLLNYKIDSFFKQKNYVKMFAYETVAAYGFLLKPQQPNWHKQIHPKTNFTDFFKQSFRIRFDRTSLSEKEIIEMGKGYGIDQLVLFETERADAIERTIALYKKKFFDDPHFTLPFTGKKSISSDSRYMVSIDQLGRVNPSMKIIADWGILEVIDVGGFLPANLDRVIISPPLHSEGKKIKGEGWILELNQGYEVVLETINGKPHYLLRKIDG
jgi:hypothetical protein